MTREARATNSLAVWVPEEFNLISPNLSLKRAISQTRNAQSTCANSITAMYSRILGPL